MKKLISIILLILMFSVPVLAQRTLVHPEKVYINPSTAAADSLKINGGIYAGPNGTVQIVDAAGALSISGTITDGSIGKIKFADDCANGELLVANNSTTAPFWDCGAPSSVGLQASTDAVITGDWRFSTYTVFGESITPQSLVHLYQDTVDTGISIQKGITGTEWRFFTDGTKFYFRDATGTVTDPLTFTLDPRVGINQTTPLYTLDVNGSFRTVGETILGSLTSNLIPTSPDTYDLGSEIYPWNRGFIASLIADIFVQQVVQIYDGYLIVGQGSGKFVGTALIGDDTIDFGRAMTLNEWILIRGLTTSNLPCTEYMQVLSLVSGTTYNVDRPEAGTECNWPDGTSYLDLGVEGDGRIEINATGGIPKFSIVSQGATATALTTLVRLGGTADITSHPGRYGLVIGNWSTGQYLAYENSATPAGDDGKLIVKGAITANEGFIGGWAITSIAISSANLVINSASEYISLGLAAWQGTGIQLQANSGTPRFYAGDGGVTASDKYVMWDGTNFSFRGANTSLDTSGNLTATNGTFTGGTIQTAINCGTTGGGACVKMTTTPSPAFKWYNSSDVLLGTIDGTGLLIENNGSTSWNGANAVRFGLASEVKRGLTSLQDSSYGGNTRNVLLLENADSRVSTLVTSIILHVGGNDYYNWGSGLETGHNVIELSRGVSGYDFISLYSKTGTIDLDAPNIRTRQISLGYNMTGGSITTTDTNESLTIDTNGTGELVLAGGNVIFNGASGWYVSRQWPNTLNAYWSSATTQYGWLNWVGHEDGTTQYRGLYIGDGKQGTIAEFRPTDRHVIFNQDIHAQGVEVQNWQADSTGSAVYTCTAVSSAGDDRYLCYRTSAARYKTNIAPARWDFNKLLNIQASEYNRKSNPSGKIEFGIIADDLANMGLEPLIWRNNEGLPEGVHYELIGAALLPVVQAQQKEIESLKARIEKLEKRKN